MTSFILGILFLAQQGPTLPPILDTLQLEPPKNPQIQSIAKPQGPITSDPKWILSEYAKQQKIALEKANARSIMLNEQIKHGGGYLATVRREMGQFKQLIDKASSEDELAKIKHQLQPRMSSRAEIMSKALCQVPTVFEVVTGYYDPAISQVDPIVSSGGGFTIYGCRLGKKPGSVHLALVSAPGNSKLADIMEWQDDYITVRGPQFEGVEDQPARVTVAMPDPAPDGTVIMPHLSVAFRAAREILWLDPIAHPGVLYQDIMHNTSDDRAHSISVDGKLGYALRAFHYVSCCGTEAGTDKWYLNIKNGWAPLNHSGLGSWTTKATEDLYQVIGYELNDNPAIVCPLRDLQPGAVLSQDLVPSTNPKGNWQFNVTWWCDWFCSGIWYAYNLIIEGPKGIPYW